MLGYKIHFALLFFVMIFSIVLVDVPANAQGNERNEGQITLYGWQGMGNGGPYMTTVQTNDCRRTVRALLHDNDVFHDNQIDKAIAPRSIWCWSQDGQLLWRSVARVIPIYEGESCLGRSEWSGLHVIEHCKGRAKRSVIFSESLKQYTRD